MFLLISYFSLFIIISPYAASSLPLPCAQYEHLPVSPAFARLLHVRGQATVAGAVPSIAADLAAAAAIYQLHTGCGRTAGAAPAFAPVAGAVAAAVYALNPFSVLSSAGGGASALRSLSAAMALLGAIRGQGPLVAMGLLLSDRPVALVLPTAAALAEALAGEPGPPRRTSWVRAAHALALPALLLGACCLAAAIARPGLQTALSALLLPEPTPRSERPNVGLTWYLWLEVFSELRGFFSCALGALRASAGAGLAIRTLAGAPPLPAAALWLWAHAALSDAPTVPELVLPMALLLLVLHPTSEFVHPAAPLVARRRGGEGALWLVALAGGISALAAMPTLWGFWVASGSGNANFFYGACLALGAAQVLLLDLVGQAGIMSRGHPVSAPAPAATSTSLAAEIAAAAPVSAAVSSTAAAALSPPLPPPSPAPPQPPSPRLKVSTRSVVHARKLRTQL